LYISFSYLNEWQHSYRVFLKRQDNGYRSHPPWSPLRWRRNHAGYLRRRAAARVSLLTLAAKPPSSSDPLSNQPTVPLIQPEVFFHLVLGLTYLMACIGGNTPTDDSSRAHSRTPAGSHQPHSMCRAHRRGTLSSCFNRERQQRLVRSERLRKRRVKFHGWLETGHDGIVSYPSPRRWNRSLYMCAHDVQITRIVTI
jgi:hypothetical protein